MGIYITRRRSGKKKFDTSLRKAIILNLIWLIINVPISLLFVYLFGDNLLNIVFIVAIDLVFGSVIAMKLYNKEFRHSLSFIFNVEVVTLFISIVILGILQLFNSKLFLSSLLMF